MRNPIHIRRITEAEQVAAFRHQVIAHVEQYPGDSWKECIDGVLQMRNLGDMYLIVATRLYIYLARDDTDALSMAAIMYYAKRPCDLKVYWSSQQRPTKIICYPPSVTARRSFAVLFDAW